MVVAINERHALTGVSNMPLRERIIPLMGAVIVAGVAGKPADAHWCNSGNRLTGIEQAICSDQGLISKDIELNDLYNYLGGRQNHQLKAGQRNWLSSRNRCTTLGCLHDYYDDRLSVLRAMRYRNPGTAAPPPPPPPVVTFTPPPPPVAVAPPPPPVATGPDTSSSATPDELEKLPDIKPF